MITLNSTDKSQTIVLNIMDTDNCKLAYMSVQEDDEMGVELTRDDLRQFCTKVLQQLDTAES